MKGLQVAFLLLLVALAACQPSGPLRSVTVGDELVAYDFARGQTFEEGVLPGAVLRIQDGTYQIRIERGDRELWWGQWGDTLGDVAVDVDVQQVTEATGNAFGVMCRVRGAVGQPQTPDPELAAMVQTDETETPEPESTESTEAEATAENTATPEAVEVTSAPTPVADTEATAESTTTLAPTDGDGYLFLIQGSGAYGIFRSSGRRLQPLVDWATSDAVNISPEANHLRAVCAGDYLAFYVNDRLVAETIDDQYSVGQVGLVASTADRLGVQVNFDNLVVHTAAVG